MASERIFVFYGCNEGARSYNSAEATAGGRIELPRSDMQLEEGYYFRFSDDQARSWSDTACVIPVRRTGIDRANPWRGKIMGMFMCDKPSVIDGAVYFAFQKLLMAAAKLPTRKCSFCAAATCSPHKTRVTQPGKRCRLGMLD